MVKLAIRLRYPDLAAAMVCTPALMLMEKLPVLFEYPRKCLIMIVAFAIGSPVALSLTYPKIVEFRPTYPNGFLRVRFRTDVLPMAVVTLVMFTSYPDLMAMRS